MPFDVFPASLMCALWGVTVLNSGRYENWGRNRDMPGIV